MRLIAHLWTHSGSPPAEYIEYILCKEVYHCRPSELRAESFSDILKTLVVMGIEGRIRKRESEDQKLFGK